MAISDRLFAPPDADAARVEARQMALPRRVQVLIRQVGDRLSGADPMSAQPLLAEALALAPAQPDVLRLYGLLLAQTGNLAAAVANFKAALDAASDDAMGYWQYARVCEEAGDLDGAFALRERAVEYLPNSPLAWADLGEHLYTWVGVQSSLAALQRAVELAPEYAPGLFKLGSAYVACGRAEEGAVMIRRALRCVPAFGAAWIGLSDIKTVPVTEQEMAQMRALLSDKSSADEGERTAIEFALAQACEQAEDHREAWERLVHANARRKRELEPWSRARFMEREDRAMDIFNNVRVGTDESSLGESLIFIVGMPRSGTTLVEQILAAHPRVHGSGELPFLPQVLTEESARRQRHYPDWVSEAGAKDWGRMGRRYLELTSVLRREHLYSTDKLPNNWQAIGAIRLMLPGARIVVCRRDPLENCWSCFKQYFGSGWAFTNDIGDLAAFWKGFDRAAAYWLQRDPGRIREQSYEALTVSPAPEIRALLAFCGLPWDDACLRFNESRRGVQTLSAAQVSQPMHRHHAVARQYGALLNPLRAALGLPAWDQAED